MIIIQTINMALCWQLGALFDKEVLWDIPEAKFFVKLPAFRHKVSDRAILRVIRFYQENKRV